MYLMEGKTIMNYQNFNAKTIDSWCDSGWELGVWVNDANIIWNEKEAGQWEMRPNALLLCLFGTNCNIFFDCDF